MSLPILPLAVWPSGINEASIPANDNALRCEILFGLVISDATDAQPGAPDDGDIYIMTGAASGAQWSTFDEFDLAIYVAANRYTVGATGGSWIAFAPVEGIVVNIAGSLYQWDGGAYAALGGGGGGVSSVNGDTGTVIVLAPIIVAASDETTPLTIGTNKVTFRLPYAFTLTAIPRASLSTAQTGSGGGGLITVDINRNGSTIFTTNLTIDNGEKTSVTATTSAVLTSAPGFPTWSSDDEITIDLDQIGDGTAKGLKVTLIGYPS